jgi:hypothetical protein
MANITKVQATVSVNGTSFSFEPETILVYDNPICQYERAVDGTLTCTHFATKKVIDITDWRSTDEFVSLLSVISAVTTIEYIHSTLAAGTETWTESEAISVYVIHPIEYQETDGRYRFSFRMEQE